MVLADWQRLSDRNREISPAWPVFFHVAGERPLQPDDYCEGISMGVDSYWDSQKGWLPCITVELGNTDALF